GARAPRAREGARAETTDRRRRARRGASAMMPTPQAPPPSRMRIETRDAELIGDIAVPEGARGLVLFAHGSGSSRKSPRNRFVAEKLGQHALATLLFDLLTPAEEEVDAFTRA